jgi:uncharacterized membrane protein YhiD involved in acid resistance
VNPMSWLDPGILGAGRFSMQLVLLSLLMSFVLGLVVAALYAGTHRGLSYSRNMVHSIVLLSMIVTMVMLVVGDSIARAFGLVGALAIIRFRTVVRDARDTTFIFLALAVGIAIGAQQFSVAVVGTLVIGMVATLLQLSGFATRHSDTGMLRVRGAGSLTQRLEEVLGNWCRTFELVALREAADGSNAEYSYEIRLFHPSEREELLRAVRAVQGTTQVTVAIEEKAEEW